MNELQARREGYTFHGAYSSRDKESIKQKAKNLRKLGNKAVVVTGQGGWSVYWIESEDSKELTRLMNLERKKNQLISEREKLQARLLEIETELSQM